MQNIVGEIVKVSGPLVVAQNMRDANMFGQGDEKGEILIFVK